MQLHGRNIIGGQTSSYTGRSFNAINPAHGDPLAPPFAESTEADVNQALLAAAGAFAALQALSPEQMAAFLGRIAEEILRVGDDLVHRANLETALPEARLTGERARTVNQIKMFADLVREGSWVEARIDRAIPDRQPAPRPLLQRMLVPIGPVVIFGASNFPLAFSVAGGDTISALAAGNPVVVKAHPAHPGTSEIAARAIQAAVEFAGLPPGVFALLHGHSTDVGLRLVRHPATRAVGFTGSLQGGRALFDAAAARPEPIPVYAEMGSTNPLFVLPSALQSGLDALAKGLVQSVTLGVGQFCTKPGLVFGVRGADWEALQQATAKLAAAVPPGTMLTPAMGDRFRKCVGQAEKIPGVRVLGAGSGQTAAIVFATDAATFSQNDFLREEMFGPGVLFITCGSADELESVARDLPGQLTATIHGTVEDLGRHQNLLKILQQKAGRLIFNGFPTGVEVCPAMHHGGPYPATTGTQFTSVGTAAIARFARPVCFQNFPDAMVPPQLRRQNTRKIWRLVDGQLTKDDL
jgi:NADP-dependent aldehyde dehydrogenase